MRVLYIGQYSEGTTSKQRADILKDILEDSEFQVIDVHIPFYKSPRIWASYGFRFKKGPAVTAINKFILSEIEGYYDLIWIDKGVYIRKGVMTTLRKSTPLLVHYTPDPAFTFHQSKLFEVSIPYYDYLITTKSYEQEDYLTHINEQQLVLTTQGFDPLLHQPNFDRLSDKQGLAFLGHFEKDRAKILQLLLDNQIDITLAGIKWGKFVKQNSGCPNLKYLGEGVYGVDYVKVLQSAKMAWGALSKWVPELHTTRTFEIPACGTALLTEANHETKSFFKPDEAIFYSNPEELLQQVSYYMSAPEVLKEVTLKGCKRVVNDGYDYKNLLSAILKRVLS